MAMNTSRYGETAEATRTPERRYQVKRKRILIVEDDRLSLIVLRQLLTAQGYEILQSSEGWDGINRARNEQPDLIVMDIKLPDISGLDATLLLKKDDKLYRDLLKCAEGHSVILEEYARQMVTRAIACSTSRSWVCPQEGQS